MSVTYECIILSFFSLVVSMEEAVKSQRAIIYFLWKEDTPTADIVHRLHRVFGDAAMGRTAVFKWVQRFQAGRQSLEDDERSGRPTTSGCQENVKVIEEVILGDRCLTIREIAAITGVSKSQVHRIMSEELHMRKLTARWVPRLLNNDQKANRKSACQELLQLVHDLGEAFWSRIVTVDETWLPFYLPETKEQSRQWCRPGDRPPLKAKTVPSAGKVMVTVFWDCDGIIHIDYLPKGVTINSAYYTNLLDKDLRKALKNKRRGKLSSIPLLQQDNARPHTAKLTVSTVQRLGWTLLPHPPYSPDLAPSDYHLFSALKKPLRGHHFANLDEMKTAVSAWIAETPRIFFDNGIRKLTQRWEKCVKLNGDYIEKFDSDSDED
mgnify:CR=1 FL=1